MTGRDTAGRLWTSPLVGPPGFVEVRSATELALHTSPPPGDPLHRLPADQKVGLVAIEFATRRRARLNGSLIETTDDLLLIDAEQAYGNCPQHIQQRRLAARAHPDPSERPGAVRHGDALTPDDTALVRAADTFFLGTTHPDRGADASHRGGARGFVRVDGSELWWPDFHGNNMFNSLGNLEVDPEAALLFLDFAIGRTLHLSGRAQVEWGAVGRAGDDDGTGRIVRFRPERLVAGSALPVVEVEQHVAPPDAAPFDRPMA